MREKKQQDSIIMYFLLYHFAILSKGYEECVYWYVDILRFLVVSVIPIVILLVGLTKEIKVLDGFTKKYGWIRGFLSFFLAVLAHNILSGLVELHHSNIC